jgi:hypothetical protein
MTPVGKAILLDILAEEALMLQSALTTAPQKQ